MERIILSTDRINFDSRRKISQSTLNKMCRHIIIKKGNILCIEDINDLDKPSSAIDSNLYYITSVNDAEHTFKVKPVIEQIYHFIDFYNNEPRYFAMLKKDKDGEEREVPFSEVIPHFFFDGNRRQMDFKYPVLRIKDIYPDILESFINE